MRIQTLQSEIKKENIKKHIGMTVGKLKLVSVVDFDGPYCHVKINAYCSCGRTDQFNAKRFLNKDFKMCNSCINIGRSKTHGCSSGRYQSRTPEYNCWLSMKIRCYHESQPNYINYGGRGISMCDSWKNDFSKFLLDMGTKPTKNHSIDRIDVNGNYEPSNCRWSTRQDQANNKRNSAFHTFNGITMTTTQWARELKANRLTLTGRLKKYTLTEIIKKYHNEYLQRK